MRRPVQFVVSLVFLAAACGGGSDGGAEEDKTRVVAGFYPLAEVASRVGGGRVAVTNLTPAGAEPHDLELSSGEIDRIESAGVVLYLGGGLQPAIEEAAARTNGRAVDLLDPDFGLIQGVPDEGGDLGADPHVWLDPSLMVKIAERVWAALSVADPAGNADYEAIAAEYTAELEALDRSFRGGLSQCERRTIVTSHAAFGYLARRYGLSQEAIAGLEPESEPDPRRLAELGAKVRAEGVTTIFYETLVSPDVAETLARETGARTAVLNPIEGLEEDEQRQGKDYTALMRDNLAALRGALGCR